MQPVWKSCLDLIYPVSALYSSCLDLLSPALRGFYYPAVWIFNFLVLVHYSMSSFLSTVAVYRYRLRLLSAAVYRYRLLLLSTAAVYRYRLRLLSTAAVYLFQCLEYTQMV